MEGGVEGTTEAAAKKTPTIDIDNASTKASAGDFQRHLRPAWNGIPNRDPTHATIIAARDTLTSFRDGGTCNTSRVLVAIELFGRATRSAAAGPAFLTDVISPKSIQACSDRCGVGEAFRILAGAIASPFVDSLTSALAIFVVESLLGLDALKYDARFPSGLLIQKSNCVSKPGTRSVMEALIDAAQADPVSGTTVKSLLALFPYPYFLAFARMACRALSGSAAEIQSIVSYISELAGE
jgi:hypothetical protein